jgi:hypothetical protein
LPSLRLVGLATAAEAAAAVVVVLVVAVALAEAEAEASQAGEVFTALVLAVDTSVAVGALARHASAWEPAEAGLVSVWVGIHHINQRRRHLSAQLQADRRIRLRTLVRLRAS